MALRLIGPNVMIAGIAAFSGTGAKQTGSGTQIRVCNRSTGLGWFVACATQVEANAAVIPTAGVPQAAYSIGPGETIIINNPNGNSNAGAWVNACTTTDTTGFMEFDSASGYGI